MALLTTLSGYAGTVELTLPSQNSAPWGRFRRLLITKICCFLWHVAWNQLLEFAKD